MPADFKHTQIQAALRDRASLARYGGLVVAQAMTLEPSCVAPGTTLLELVKLFHAKGFRHLLVSDAQRLVGVISDRDVLRWLGPDAAASSDLLKQRTAADVMSADLVTVGPEMPLDRAVSLMLEQGISCLPVLRGETLQGILTNTDLHVVLQLLLENVRQSALEESLTADACNLHD